MPQTSRNTPLIYRDMPFKGENLPFVLSPLIKGSGNGRCIAGVSCYAKYCEVDSYYKQLWCQLQAPRSLSVLLLTNVTWIKFIFRLEMDVKLRTLGAGETHDLQQHTKYPPLPCFSRGNVLSSFNFFLRNKPYIIHGAMSCIPYSLTSVMTPNIVEEVSPLPCTVTLMLFFHCFRHISSNTL